MELRCSTKRGGQAGMDTAKAGSGTTVSAAVKVASGGTGAEVHCHVSKAAVLTFQQMQQQAIVILHKLKKNIIIYIHAHFEVSTRW